MNNRTESQKLLGKYLDGEATPKEKQSVEKWYADFEQAQVAYSKADSDRIETDLRKGVYHRLDFNERPKQKKTARLSYIAKIAASILLPLIIGLSIWRLTDRSTIKPADLKWIALETKAGERKKIILIDGTEIWLNAASRILYPEKFDETQRLVELVEGEAYFNVTHNKQHPFKVITPNRMYTKVLGTSFIISAYAESNTVSVMVTSGKVAVGKDNKELAKLEKGQVLSMNKITSAVNNSKTDNADAWTRDQLIFNGHSLTDVAKVLSRAYGINVTISKNVNGNLKCRGNFNLNQYPQEIVKVLCSLHGLSYSSMKDKIIIKPGK